MAEIEDRTLFSEYLYEGIVSLKSHPQFKTIRKKRVSSLTSESYLDKISYLLGVSPNTLKSWIGQMGKKYIPSRIEDGKLFSVIWIIMKYTDMDINWFHSIMRTTSIPILEHSSESWFRACVSKAKIKLEDFTFGRPSNEEIDAASERLFPTSDDVRSQPIEPSSPQYHLPAARNGLSPQQSVIHNLPNRSVTKFIGRNMHAELIRNWLTSHYSICLVNGLGGMGKSTLALELAYSCTGHPSYLALPDASWPIFSNVIWVSADLKHMSFNYFLDTIAYQLGRVELLEHSLNEKQFIVRNALNTSVENGQILIIIDNVNDTNVDILSFILNLPANIKVLLTSRDHELNLFNKNTRNVFSITLEGFESDEALTFLKDELQRQASQTLACHRKQRLQTMLETSKEEMLELAMITAGNPKAIELSVAYISDQDIELSSFIEDVKSASFSLNSIFDYIFGHTWNSIDEEVKKLWITLHFFQTPPDEVSWAQTAGMDKKTFHTAINQMKGHALISSYRDNQTTYYVAHHTVIAYGEHQSLERPIFLDHAKERWAKYYIQYIDSQLRNPDIDHPYWAFLPSPKVSVVKTQWLIIHSVLQWADQHNKHELLIEIMLKLSHFLSRISLPVRIEYGLKAANAAHIQQLWIYEALFKIDTIAWACFELGDNAAAYKHLHSALKILEQHHSTMTADEKEEYTNLYALAQQSLARYYFINNDLTASKKHIILARDSTTSPIILHRTLLTHGNLLSKLGHYKEALSALEQAFEVSLSYGEYYSVESCYFLGLAYLHCDKWDQAEQSFTRLLRDETNANQLEQIYYQFGIAQLYARKQWKQEAIDRLNHTLQLIDSWEQGIRVRHEIIQLLEQLHGHE